MSQQRLCPCGSTKIYQSCCGRFISGEMNASSAEELMRSRYAAYHDGRFDYIVKTMKPPASARFSLESAKKRAKNMQWTQLQIVKATPPQDEKAFVEFIASFTSNNKVYKLHEISEFRWQDNQWFYVDAVFVNA